MAQNLKHPRETLTLSTGRQVDYMSLPVLAESAGIDLDGLPYSVRILLESVARRQGEPGFAPAHLDALSAWTPGGTRSELPFLPGRILLQDFTGVPCVVDLAALRSASTRAGADPARIEPMLRTDLVIDHSVQLDETGTACALQHNMEIEFRRNAERYRFLKWGQNAFDTLNVLPPGLGICHQVNMEHLADVVSVREDGLACPDTLVGTDSHTTTINCLGVLGWGVGGIEAEAALLGQPMPMLSPRVVGFRFTGRLREGVTATDLALTVVRMLREKGVVGHFVEFFGDGVEALSLADRCPVANMAPEYGATTGFFPVDGRTIEYLRETGRTEEHCELVEQYCRAQGLWREPGAAAPGYDDTLELDLGEVESAIAGPRKPHEQMTLSGLPEEFGEDFGRESGPREADVPDYGTLRDGAVIIASVTSCTNTSNPDLMIGAALVARKAAERGLRPPYYTRTSFAPGSRVVRDYLEKAGLMDAFDALGFQVAAYGCATCIGNSGPCPAAVDQAVREHGLNVAAVLSGNRNFEGRVSPLTRANYLCSPPLVIAYALAGRVDIDLSAEPVGHDRDGQPVYLRDLWFTEEELAQYRPMTADPASYRAQYGDQDRVNPEWNRLAAPGGAVFEWEADSTYVREPPFFEGCGQPAGKLDDVREAAILALLGDFITTDHISPAGEIPKDGPAAAYLRGHGVDDADFNSFGSRRGNHEVMMRGTFANIRIRNRLVEREGGWTKYLGGDGSEQECSIFEASERYRADGRPMVVVAGKMYGAGSSRDWAAKGPALLGVRAVIAESFERIHRSNLVGMGVIPFQFREGETAQTLGLSGRERITIEGLARLKPGGDVEVVARPPGGGELRFTAVSRVDTDLEREYIRHGGVLRYVLRKMLNTED
ncbi:aconitate hydratase AcnA [Kiritimatiella glycovorans]|uniref:Aconitate hydratase n=1 Tax=Kiritimatiella glycovorans TaxID=1307763 RepID=A0A0G3ECK2_9BACT|nr:aconitate hydratase AcnA [Kiritimatiella glycovorans]AKJ64028.1 Aconitate hydratase [Kiritimatiella glycovorans]